MSKSTVVALACLWSIVCAGAGYKLHRCPPVAPAKAEALQASRAEDVRAEEDTTDAKAGERVTVTEYAAPQCPAAPQCGAYPQAPAATLGSSVPAPAPQVVVRQTVTERGPEVVQTHSARQDVVAEQVRSTSTSTPPLQLQLPNHEVSVGFSDVFDTSSVRAGVGVRMIGDFWLRGGVQPDFADLKHTKFSIDVAYQF